MFDQQPNQSQITETYSKFEEKMIELLCAEGAVQEYFIAETGSGKSRAIVECIKEYGQELRLALVLNSKEEVKNKYEELVHYMGGVRHWLSVESSNLEKSDLKSAQIAIVTHQFFDTPSNRNQLGKRDIFIVDESPIWKKLRTFTAEDLEAARAASVKPKDKLQPAVAAHVWLTTQKPLTKFLPFTEANYPEVFAGLRLLSSDGDWKVKEVLERAEEGRAILYTDKHKNKRNSPVSIVYPLKNPLRNDKVLIVSATAHLEGGQLRQDPPQPSIEGDFRNLEVVRCEWPDMPKEVKKATTEDQDTMFDVVAQILRSPVKGETLIVGYNDWNPRFHQRLKTDFQSFSGDSYEVNGHTIHLLHHGTGVGSNNYRDCEEVIYIGLQHIPKFVNLAEVFYHTGEQITEESLARVQQKGGELDQLRIGKQGAETKQMAARGKCRISVEGVASPMRAWLIVPSDQMQQMDLKRLFPNCKIKQHPESLIYAKREPTSVQARLMLILRATNNDQIFRSELDRLYCEMFGVSSGVVNKNTRDIPSWLEGSGWNFVAGKKGKGGEAYFERVK